MILWGAASILSLVVVAAFARSWSRLPEGGSDDPLAPIKAQLADLEADHRTGALPPEAYGQAKLELERRLLRLHKTVSGRSALKRTSMSRNNLMIGLSLAVGGWALYGLLGSPDQPAEPGARVQIADVPLQENGPTLGEARAAIEGKLKSVPDDIEALGMLVRVTTALGDHGATGRAAQRLIILDAGNPTWHVEALQAYLRSSQGRPTPGARLILEAFQTAHPGHPVAVFHTARMQALDGDRAGAEATLVALAERSDPAAPWMTEVRGALAALRGENTPNPLSPRGPSEADVAAASEMSTADRAAFIENMVSQLASRLAENPADPEGWERLARARFVLSGADAARTVLMEAIEKNPGSTERYSQLLDSLEENGQL